MTNSFSPAVRHLCARYRTQADSTRRGSHEAHDLRSLSQRLLLSPDETLEQVAAGNLISLACTNGKHLFSSRSLDVMRNQVVSFIAGEIVEELEARGFSEDRIIMALSRAFQKQHELSRGRAERIVEFDQGNNGNFVNGVGTGVGIAAGGLGAYGAYRYWKGRRNPDGTPMLPGPNGSGSGGDDGSGPQSPQSGGGGPRTPRDPNSSATGIDTDINGRHPGPPSGALTTASPTPDVIKKTAGQIAGADELSEAITKGKSVMAQRGSALWKALRAVALAE